MNDIIMPPVGLLLCVVHLIKLMNTVRKAKEAAPPAPPKPSNEEALLAEIRDLLKKGR